MPTELSLDKVPPQNLEAEMAVLGAMLIDEYAVGMAAEHLQSNCFYKETHRKIFEAILSLFGVNKAVDLITLTDELKRNTTLQEIGGVGYLTSLVNSVPTTANINHYINIVREKSILRTLINNANKVIALCYESEGDIERVVDDAEKLIFEVSDNRPRTGFLHLKEIIKDSIETIDKKSRNVDF